MTKAITKLKNSLGDGYENKLDETVKSGKAIFMMFYKNVNNVSN